MKQQTIDRLLTALILVIIGSAILINLSEIKLSIFTIKNNIELTSKK